MNYRRLGRTGLQVSEVGFGSHHFDRDGKRIGALTQNSFTERERIEHVATALDLGINYLHCAFTIGEVHNAEIVLFGKALKELGRRNECYLVAQVMSRADEQQDLSNQALRARVQAQVEDHLRDLRTDVLDILEINVGRDTDALLLDRIVACAQNVRDAGKVRFLGAVSHDIHLLIDVLRRSSVFDTIGTPYNVLRPSAREHLLPLAWEKDVGVEGIQPFGKGEVLRLDPNDARLQPFRKDSQDSVARLALRWVLLDEHLSVTIPGMKSVEEVAENVAISSPGSSLGTRISPPLVR